MFTVSGIAGGQHTWLKWVTNGELGMFVGPLSTHADLAIEAGEMVQLSPEAPEVLAGRDNPLAAYSLAHSLFDEVIDVFSTDPLPLENDPGGVVEAYYEEEEVPEEEAVEGAKGRTYIDPYLRDDGVPVAGHWRDVPTADLQSVMRPEGITDEQLRGYFARDPEGDELLEPGVYDVSKAFVAVTDINDLNDGLFDEPPSAMWAQALGAADSLHKIESTEEAPLRVIPIIHGTITKDEEGTMASGTLCLIPRDEEKSDMMDEAWPTAIFVGHHSTANPQIALLHEVGHYIDQQMFGEGVWSSRRAFIDDDESQPAFEVIQQAMKTPTIGRLAYMLKHDDEEYPVKVIHQDGTTEKILYKADKDHLSYLLNPEEIFARAYSQWVATRAGIVGADDHFLHRRMSGRAFYPEHWEEDEFEPIAEVFDQLF